MGLEAVRQLAEWLSCNNPNTPKVTFPEAKVQEKKGIVDKLLHENNVKKLQVSPSLSSLFDSPTLTDGCGLHPTRT